VPVVSSALVDVVAEIEAAFVGHWSVFGRWSRGELHEEHGILWFETPIRHLPYNAVIRTRVEGEPEAAIESVCERFGARGVEFFWLVHPTAAPADLGERLAAYGVRPVEVATGMSIGLADWRETALPGDVSFVEVLDDAQLQAYQELTVRYWEVTPEDAGLVAEFQREWGPGRAPGHRYLALVDGVPVAKSYLSLAAPDGVAAIYAVSVLPQARGHGIAGGLTTVMLRRARELGRRRVVLHSSEMAVGLYRRAGFVERCRFTVHATAPLWTSHH
jgi:ribosomal protein S18 acetylase RimI-like enzyme